jgi:hypothetical protein
MPIASSQVSWRRLLLESAVVVVSILFAFSIDAGWDSRQERQRESVVLRGILADFEATRPDLTERLATARRLRQNSVVLRDRLAEEAGQGRITVPDTIVLSVIGAPTFQPATNTLDAALASGEIDLIQSDEIRRELAQWRTTLSDTFESEQEVRRITTDRLEPLLSRDVALGPYYDIAVTWDAGTVKASGYAELTPTLELSGAVAARAFYQDFAVTGLSDLLAILDRVNVLIELGTR